MKITLNHTAEEFDVNVMSVNDLLARKNYTFKMLVIKINGGLVKKTDYDSTFIREGDDVSVLHLISGG
jgi:sulfur carrier protein